MRKYLLALIIVIAMSIPAFADSPASIHDITNTATATATATANGGAGGSATASPTFKDIGNVTIGGGLFSKTLSPEASAEQKQKQILVNQPDQTIAPNQEVTFKSPTQLLASPSQSLSELNFGSGSLKDVTAGIPNFAIYGIGKYKGEPIRKILSSNANVKFKNYFQAILDDAMVIAGKDGFKSSEVRLIVACAEAQKSWTSGGNLGGAGSAVPTSGLAGGSMAGSFMPQWGGTKADPLYTIFFVQVNDGSPAKVILYEKKSKAPKTAPISTEPRGWFRF